ncbi:hypothetical protein ACO2Q2_13285 [Dyella sp. KRB-257]|uniref:terminase small subunit-like protein n=1 Tax=Dyella sp. KRB-257 TaxID=3400915 RepID=UPI003BFD3EA7
MAPPRKYDRKKIVDRICKDLINGKPMTIACRAIPIPVRTVNQWREDDIEIANQLDDAFDEGMDSLAWRMRMTARGKKAKQGGDSTGDTDRDKLIIYTEEKLLANWSTRYSRRVTLSGDPKNPLMPPPTQMTEAQLLAIAAQGVRDQGEDGGKDG